MQGIYVAAVITTGLSVAIIGSMIFWKRPRAERVFLATVILLEVPMCALAFYFVRLPLDGWLRTLLGLHSGIYKFLTTLYVPITEEAAKLWFLLLPPLFKKVNSKNIIRTSMAVGLGFGIGEMWLIAVRLANSPQIGSLPWYSLGGYINERFMVCIMHGVFTAMALRQLRRVFFMGIAGAAFLHFLGNFPIYLAGINFAGIGRPAWQIILGLWVSFYFMFMLALLAYFTFGKLEKITIFLYGKARCPQCGLVYSRPLFGINMVTRRYERCPGCHKYHWTRKLPI